MVLQLIKRTREAHAFEVEQFDHQPEHRYHLLVESCFSKVGKGGAHKLVRCCPGPRSATLIIGLAEPSLLALLATVLQSLRCRREARGTYPLSSLLEGTPRIEPSGAHNSSGR